MRGDEWFTGCFLYDGPDQDLARTTLDLPAAPGVVLFADADDHPIVLLTAADVRRLVRRRLGETPDDQLTRRTRLTPVVRHVWWRSTWSPFETRWAWFAIARALYPDTWDELLHHPRAWMLALPHKPDLATFEVTSRPLDTPSRYWGPFPTRQSATAALQVIQDLFDLCRCPNRLREGECVADCPYAQMGRCAAAVDLRISCQAHRRALDLAGDFLDRPLDDALARIETRMSECARTLQFEQAQHFKRQLERARSLAGPSGRWAGPLRDFAVFSLQPGPPESLIRRRRRPRVAPFLIHPDGLDPLEPVPLEQLEDAAVALFEQWRRRRDQAAPAESFDPAALAWVTQLLYRKPDEPSLFLSARDCHDPANLARLARERFDRPDKPPPDNEMPLDNGVLPGQ